MLPKVILHNAVSLDGRMDWLAADQGLYYELASRWQADAMLCGSNTILAAFPNQDGASDAGEYAQPVQAVPGDGRPWLVVVDSRGRIRTWSEILRAPYWRGAIALGSEATPPEYRDLLQRHQVELILAGEARVDLGKALELLHQRFGIELVRVDSGGMLNGALLRAGLVHEVSLLIHPCLVGGRSPSSMFAAADLSSPERVVSLRFLSLERLRGDVVWLRYEVLPPVTG